MGCFRLFLALAVLNAHYRFWQLGPEGYSLFPTGGFAVCIFYVISGFYMSMVITQKYQRLPDGTLRFYGNRALRLFPVYLAVLAATVVLTEAGWLRSVPK